MQLIQIFPIGSQDEVSMDEKLCEVSKFLVLDEPTTGILTKKLVLRIGRKLWAFCGWITGESEVKGKPSATSVS
jgi:hypothetical protein